MRVSIEAGSRPFNRQGPAIPEFPVILAVPHAGRDYPASLLADSAVPQTRLMQLEDRYADALIEPVVAMGGLAIVANRARAWIDLNRDPREIDPGMLDGPPSPDMLITARARGGLGLIPRRVGHGIELWRRKFSRKEILARVAETHRPYHLAISEALAAAHARFGIAVLLDCHSMPPLRRDRSELPALIVIGDRFGRSAASCFSDCIEAVVRRLPLPLSRNVPYAGGYGLDHHAAPARGIHAIQVEIDRRLYLDPALDLPGDGLKSMQAIVKAMFEALVEEALARPMMMAAE